MMLPSLGHNTEDSFFANIEFLIVLLDTLRAEATSSDAGDDPVSEFTGTYMA